MIHDKRHALLDPSSPHLLSSLDSFKQFLNRTKTCSSDVQSCDSTFCLLPFCLDPELQLCLVSAVKAFPDLPISHKVFPFVDIVFRRGPTHVWSLMTSVRKLSSMSSTNSLDCSVAYQQISRVVKCPMKTRAYEYATSFCCQRGSPAFSS